MKPEKDSKRMWYTGGAFYIGFPIDYVPVRESTKKYLSGSHLEYHSGAFWMDTLKGNLHETEEGALEHFHKERKKRIAKLKREIASLEKAKPKWRVR